MVTKINSSEIGQVYKEYKALIIFSADWCGACHSLLDTFEKSFSDTEVKAFNINITNDEEIIAKMGIKSLPTIIAYKNGEEIGRMENYQSIHNILHMFI